MRSEQTRSDPLQYLRSMPATSRWLVLLVASSLWLTVFGDLPARAVALYSDSIPAHPYVRLDHGLMLYVGVPLSILAATFVYLSPGLTALLAIGRPGTVAPWLLEGFGLSFLIHVLLSTGLKFVAPLPVTRTVVLVAAISVALLSWLGWVMRRDGQEPGSSSPWDQEGRRRLWGLLAMSVIALVALAPVILWQDMTEDGLEALEIGRSLSWWIVPRFLNESGVMGLGIGMLSMAFPSHWYGMLFGWHEATARFPLVLYLIPTVAGIISLIELKSPRRLRAVEDLLVMAAVASVAFVLAYNASYDEYFADLASPATFAFLTSSAMLGIAYGLWSSRWWTFLGFAIMAFGARPTGLLFVLILGGFSWFAFPEERKRILRWCSLAVAVSVVFYMLYERIFIPWAATEGAVGYSTGTILGRFQFLRFFEVERLAWIIVPAGILPAIMPPLKKDRIGIALALATLAYTAVFFFPAFTNLHHFVPAMLLPLVVFWRRAVSGPSTTRRNVLVAVGIFVAVVLSRPRSFEINRTMREIGATASYQIGGYGPSRDDYREAIAGAHLTSSLFLPTWDVADPATEVVGGAQLWFYSARKEPSSGEPLYVFLPRDAAGPEDYLLHFSDEDGSVYLRDSTSWINQRMASHRTDFRSPVYSIPRETRFYFLGIPSGAYDLDMGRIPLLGRLF